MAEARIAAIERHLGDGEFRKIKTLCAEFKGKTGPITLDENNRIIAGQGSYSLVLIGTCPKRGEVAVKITKANKRGYTYWDSQQKEHDVICALRAFKRPREYVVKYFHNILHSHRSLQVMEFAQASLYDVIRGKSNIVCPTDGVTILDWVKYMCRGLIYLHHQQKITHNDLKTANLLVTGVGKHLIKITDFSFARKFECVDIKDQKVCEVQGTVPYVSPEIIDTLVKGTPRARRNLWRADLPDCWSLGCITVELVSKHYCFNPKLPGQEGVLEVQRMHQRSVNLQFDVTKKLEENAVVLDFAATLLQLRMEDRENSGGIDAVRQFDNDNTGCWKKFRRFMGGAKLPGGIAVAVQTTYHDLLPIYPSWWNDNDPIYGRRD